MALASMALASRNPRPGLIRRVPARGFSRRLAAGVVLALALVSAGAAATPGSLTQLAGPDGCVSETGTSGACAAGRALEGAVSVALSLDGKHLYVAALDSGAVAVFARNRATGVLTQRAGLEGCVSNSGSAGACAAGRALDGARSVAVSPDGKHAYVAARDDDAVSVFARHRGTGALTQLAGADGCVNLTGADGCVPGAALDGARAVAVSPDGKHVYVAADLSDAVAVFARDRLTGILTQLAGTDGCVSQGGGACAPGTALDGARSVTVSPDGKHVYVAAEISNAVAVFTRNRLTGALTQRAGPEGCVSQSGAGGCATATALDGPRAVALSPDGKHAYIAASPTPPPAAGAVAAFARNRVTGALTQLAGTGGCVSDDGSAGACADGTALKGARGVGVSRDGENVYVTAFACEAIAVFARDRLTGVLTQLPSPDGCVSDPTGSAACPHATALRGPSSVAVSRDGKHVYAAASTSDAVAVFARH